MSSTEFNCKKIFQNAFEKRYTWPKNFSGYKGSCSFQENNNNVLEGEFVVGKNFQPKVKNIDDNEVVKMLSSQLFEVVIHRVKKSFNELHSRNDFNYLGESPKGIEMEVSGKNQGDKYRVKNEKINMVFRKIHGIIIEIFVEDFLNTDNGYLSCNYSSQQLEPYTLTPKTPKYEYFDNFIYLKNTKLWVLESRTIKYRNNLEEKILQQFLFKDLQPIS